MHVSVNTCSERGDNIKIFIIMNYERSTTTIRKIVSQSAYTIIWQHITHMCCRFFPDVIVNRYYEASIKMEADSQRMESDKYEGRRQVPLVVCQLVRAERE